MKLLFLEPISHLERGCCDFLIAPLERLAQVQRAAIDVASLESISALESFDFGDFDVALLWHLDLLAPFFLSRGCPAIVVPSPVDVVDLSATHWFSIEGALVLAFDRQSHLIARKHGYDSFYARYPSSPGESPCDLTASVIDDLSGSTSSSMRQNLCMDMGGSLDTWKSYYQSLLLKRVVDYVGSCCTVASALAFPVSAMDCLAVRFGIPLGGGLVRESSRSSSALGSHGSALDYCFELVELLGCQALPVIDDMLRRPLMICSPEEKASLLEFLHGCRDLCQSLVKSLPKPR